MPGVDSTLALTQMVAVRPARDHREHGGGREATRAGRQHRFGRSSPLRNTDSQVRLSHVAGSFGRLCG